MNDWVEEFNEETMSVYMRNVVTGATMSIAAYRRMLRERETVK